MSETITLTIEVTNLLRAILWGGLFGVTLAFAQGLGKAVFDTLFGVEESDGGGSAE